MKKRTDKAQVIVNNIEGTIMNAVEDVNRINKTGDKKTQRELLAKNERRERAIPSMVKDFKEEIANRELDLK